MIGILILFLLIVVLALFVPRLGKAVAVLIALIGMAGGGVYYFERAEIEAAKKRIGKNEIELQDLVFASGVRLEAFVLRGRLKNRSRDYTLNYLEFKVIAEDCVAADQCEIVGEDVVVVTEDIPPQQVRGLKAIIKLSSLPQLKGDLKWSHSILEIRGE